MNHQPAACCSPGRGVTPAGRAETPVAPGESEVVHGDVAVPGGRFDMGDAFGEGYPADGETPVHPVEVGAFRIDATAVTNAMFARFIAATGFRTDAERYGSSAVFHLLSTADRDEVIGAAAGASWWLNVATRE
ncbi:hypothetical protein BJH93_00735 [Kocuria polaris]|nr:hypothetical protein [Kocuria polaris]